MAGEATYRLGNSVKVTIGDNTIGGQQDCTLTMESDTGETTTKDSGMWSDAEVTGLSWSVDCSGLIPVSDAAVTALETAWKTGNKVTIKYGNTTTYKTGEAIIESLEQNDAMKEKSTYKVKFKGCGELTDGPSQ